MRILKRLFSPEEAEFALHLNLIPEKTMRKKFGAIGKIIDIAQSRMNGL